MSRASKPAIKSLGVLGSIGAMGTLIGLVSTVFAWWESIPDELKEATMVFVTGHAIVFIQQLMALIGRWRATLPIQGLFKQK